MIFWVLRILFHCKMSFVIIQATRSLSLPNYGLWLNSRFGWRPQQTGYTSRIHTFILCSATYRNEYDKIFTALDHYQSLYHLQWTFLLKEKKNVLNIVYSCLWTTVFQRAVLEIALRCNDWQTCPAGNNVCHAEKCTKRSSNLLLC